VRREVAAGDRIGDQDRGRRAEAQGLDAIREPGRDRLRLQVAEVAGEVKPDQLDVGGRQSRLPHPAQSVVVGPEFEAWLDAGEGEEGCQRAGHELKGLVPMDADSHHSKRPRCMPAEQVDSPRPLGENQPLPGQPLHRVPGGARWSRA